MLLNCWTLYASKFGILSSGHRTGNVVFIPIQKKGDFKECSSPTQSHWSHMLPKQYLQASLQQYVNCDIPYVQAGLRKVRGTRDQTANIRWIIEKARELQKNTYLCFIDFAKAFDCVDYKLWKTYRDWNTRPSYLPSKKSVCRPRSNSENWTWNSRLVPNQERSMSRLYIVTLIT